MRQPSEFVIPQLSLKCIEMNDTGFDSSLYRHEASAEYRLGQKLGLESRSGLLGGSSHCRDSSHPIC
jgi:hypothetical protein